MAAVPTSLTIEIQKAFNGPDGTPSYDPTTNLYVDPTSTALEVLYRVTGVLTSMGSPVSFKLITITYNGSSFGNAYTDSNGVYWFEHRMFDTPGSYVMTSTFAGDAGYLTSNATKNFKLRLIPTSISLLSIPPSEFPENQFFVTQGTVVVNWPEWYWDGFPLEFIDVNLLVDSVLEQTDTTGSDGKFKLSHFFAVAATASIQVESDDTNTYAGAKTALFSLDIVNHWYPQPEDVEVDCYAWVLCIDPNGVRAGPMYYILDDATVKPGLTDKTGNFAGELNDNQKIRDADSFTQYAMYLLGENKEFILDQDEFWIGLQRGAATKRYDPENFSWNPSGGTDGKGSGIHWLMGGYISKRYYVREISKRVTAIIIGKSYLDVWKDQYFGTDAIPRDYTEPTSLDVIANDIFADINAQQPDGYKYTTHPTYWQTATTTLTINASYSSTILEVVDVSPFTPGDIIRISDANGTEELKVLSVVDTAYLQQLNIQSYPIVDPVNPGIQSLLGYNKKTATISPRNGLMTIYWQKVFVDENAFDIMQSMCQEAVYEFGINYLKQCMFYPKNTPPHATNRDIRYETNIRHIPEIVMGDTENIVTDVIVRDGMPTTYPDNIDLWASIPTYWYEIGNSGIRAYGNILGPAPANPVTEAYTDSSLVIDDENRAALCWQHEGAQTDFLLHFGYRLLDSVLGGGATVESANMNLDLRTYRRLKWKWRHLTWNGVKPDHVTAAITDNIYAVQLHTALNDVFIYYFGEGTQETLGLSNNDLIEASPSTVGVPQDTGYVYMDIELPEPNDDGSISFIDPAKMKGWITVGAPDPMDINWVSFFVRAPEAAPNSGYARASGYKTLVSVVPGAGDQHIQVTAPENLAGFQTGSQTHELVMRRPIDAEINGEGVQIRVIYPRTAPTTENIRLEAPLITGKALGNPVRVLAGKTFGFSQLRFERDFQGTGTKTALGPKRYRVYKEEEFVFQNEANAKVDELLNVEGTPRKWVKVVIDGDPEKEVGTSVRVYLDPNHNEVYQNIAMLVDDITYSLDSVDLETTLVLTPLTISPKAREINEYNIADKSNLDSRRRNNRGSSNYIERKGGGAGVR